MVRDGFKWQVLVVKVISLWESQIQKLCRIAETINVSRGTGPTQLLVGPIAWQPQWDRAFSLPRTHDHTQNNPRKTPLDALSASHKYLYLTTHKTHKRETSMPPAEFEPATPASEWTQTLTVGGLGTVGMVTSNGSTEEINSISYIYRVTLSVYCHFYHQTLDTSLKRGSLDRVIHPNIAFWRNTPISLDAQTFRSPTQRNWKFKSILSHI